MLFKLIQLTIKQFLRELNSSNVIYNWLQLIIKQLHRELNSSDFGHLNTLSFYDPQLIVHTFFYLILAYDTEEKKTVREISKVGKD